MPHVARNERLIDNGRPPPRTERTAARELYVHGGKPRLGESGDCEISGRPSGVRGDTDSVAGSGKKPPGGVGGGGAARRRFCLGGPPAPRGGCAPPPPRSA